MAAKRKARIKSRSLATRPPAPAALPPAHSHAPDLAHTAHARSLFWENSVREMLTGLSMIMMSGKHPEMFDGRFAVLTRGGERVPIAEVWPMFACNLTTSADDKAASTAVECTVFRIQTPDGEVYTMPLSEVRALHTLTPELMAALERQAMERAARSAARAGQRSQRNGKPFGLAAFTSLSRPGAPTHPPSIDPLE